MFTRYSLTPTSVKDGNVDKVKEIALENGRVIKYYQIYLPETFCNICIFKYPIPIRRQKSIETIKEHSLKELNSIPVTSMWKIKPLFLCLNKLKLYVFFYHDIFLQERHLLLIGITLTLRSSATFLQQWKTHKACSVKVNKTSANYLTLPHSHLLQLNITHCFMFYVVKFYRLCLLWRLLSTNLPSSCATTRRPTSSCLLQIRLPFIFAIVMKGDNRLWLMVREMRLRVFFFRLFIYSFIFCLELKA